VKLAIFDVDGTLLDNVASEDVCYAAALIKGLGLAALDTDWRTYRHVTDEGVAREAFERAFGVPPSAEAIARTIDHFLTFLADAHAQEPLRSISGAAELLETLSARGWTLALATGAWQRAARYKLAAAELPIDDLPLATAEDGPARVAIVQAAWARAGNERAPFNRVVLVGDAVWDVASAQALGLPFVGRATGERATELRARGATVVFDDYTNLEAVVTAFDVAGVPLATTP